MDSRTSLIKVGNSCNNNCSFCSAICQKEANYLSIPEILKSIKNSGAEKILFPCNTDCRPDFMQILKLSADHGKKVILRTNARIWSYLGRAEQIIDLIESFEVLYIGKYSSTAKITMNESVLQSYKGIMNLLQSGLPVQALTVITLENYHILDDIAYELKSLGISQWKVSYPIYHQGESGSLQIQECYAFIEKAKKAAKDLGITFMPEILHNPYLPKELFALYPEILLSHGSDDDNIEISIIIPSYERKELLKNTLQSLSMMKKPRGGFEVIVVEDGSRDVWRDIPEIIKGLDIKYIYWPRKRPYNPGESGNRAGPARNIGSLHAKGEYLLFLDSDVLLPEDFLLRILKDKDEVQTGLRKYLKPGFLLKQMNGIEDNIIEINNPLEKELKEAGYAIDSLENPWRFLSSHSLFIRKSLFMEMGGFDRNFIFWGDEDQEFGYRLHKAGIPFGINADAVCYHQHHDPEYIDDSSLISMKRIHKEIFYKIHLDKEIYYAYPGFTGSTYLININLCSLCNADCVFCFDQKEKRGEKVFLDTRHIQRLIDDCTSIGISGINLSGGEPTLHQDIIEIIEYASNKGIAVSMNTNGSMSSHILKKLAGSGIRTIIFSIDSYIDEVNDRLKRSKGITDIAKRNIKELREINPSIRIIVQSVLQKDNLPYLIDHIDYFRGSGIDGVSIQALNPLSQVKSIGDKPILRRHIDNKALWIEDKVLLRHVIGKIIETSTNDRFILNNTDYLSFLLDYYSGDIPEENASFCRAFNHIGVDYDGSVMPCWGIKWEVGNIKEDSIKDIVRSRVFKKARESMASCKIPCMLMCYGR